MSIDEPTLSITICSDSINETFIDDYYKRSKKITSINTDSKTYRDHHRYMKIIGNLNAENIESIEEFESTELLKNLRGEEILDIAVKV